MIAPAMLAKPARFAAPIALAVVAVSVYLIVHAGLGTHKSPGTTTGQTTLLGHSGTHVRHHATPRFYVVKSGDTLGGISVKTHIPILTITNLNPGINPNSLQTGQRLRLRR
jgi:LysM repeat protein